MDFRVISRSSPTHHRTLYAPLPHARCPRSARDRVAKNDPCFFVVNCLPRKAHSPGCHDNFRARTFSQLRAASSLVHLAYQRRLIVVVVVVFLVFAFSLLISPRSVHRTSLFLHHISYCTARTSIQPPELFSQNYLPLTVPHTNIRYHRYNISKCITRHTRPGCDR